MSLYELNNSMFDIAIGQHLSAEHRFVKAVLMQAQLCVCVCVCVCVCERERECVCVRVGASMYICIYVCMYVCMYVYTHTHIHAYLMEGAYVYVCLPV
jgi:hypothetical protein